MLDPIALLQSLTLPAGAITGQRIVLDGVNGVIQIFDAAGVLKLQLSPNNQDGESALDAFDNAGNRIDKVSQSGFVHYDVAGTVRVRIGNALLSVADAAANTRISLSSTFLLIQDAAGTEVFSVDTTSGDAKVKQASLPRGIVVAPNVSSAATTGITTVETKDGGCGDYTFTAIAGRRYRVKYQARARSTVAGDKVDIRIRDGGASSPTNVSTLIAGAETSSGSTTGDDLKVESAITLSAGTHIIAAFYVRAAGTGTITLDQATGQNRELYVEDIGAI